MVSVYDLPKEWTGGIDATVEILELDECSVILDWDILDEGGMGELEDFDDEENAYHITIDPTLSPEDTWRTLIHELVHVKQYQEGSLTDDSWLGKPIAGYIGRRNKNLPWEMEAYSLEDDIYRLLLKRGVIH